ncbi:MAG: hypothetical protein ACQES2_04440 [Pseudomonadota bacterium]
MTDLLRKIKTRDQADGDSVRHWYQSTTLDLFVWEDDRGLSAFQLCYDRHKNEHMVFRERGGQPSHWRVDSGEQPGKYPEAPTAGRSSTAVPATLPAQFDAAAEALPEATRQAVLDALKQITATEA